MESYQSGTVIVTSHEPNTPHFYVYGYDDNHRRNIAVDLEIFLNHCKQLPEWVYGLYRHPDDPTTLIDGKGISISMVGPMVLPENDNGALNWQTDMSENAKKLREFLINRIFEESQKIPDTITIQPIRMENGDWSCAFTWISDICFIGDITSAMNGAIQWANQNNKRIKWKEPIIH